jgi:monothiol glutaredoxin
MLRVLTRLPRPAPQLRCLSGSHNDFETVKKVAKTPAGVQEQIKGLVEGAPVLLFMKGTPQQPQCGFSQQVCRVLHATGVEFDSVNILEDDSIREGVKAYSEWPTIPQLYVGGEFVGGCDIVTEAFQSGELDETFKAAGVKE